jgi:DNA-directed RNA polymerase specialized sigma24 family protein
MSRSMGAARTGYEALGQQTFDKLLEWLHPDRKRAAEEYENIRARLMKLFAWRGAHSPDACVDETIDRVARRIAEGAVAGMSDPIRYCAAVAWNVCSEVQRRERRSEVKEFASPPSEDGQSEERLYDCMERCLHQLAAAERSLMIDYHTGEWRVRLGQREQLVKDLGISPNALRLRCSRIRGKLDSCLKECLRA